MPGSVEAGRKECYATLAELRRDWPFYGLGGSLYDYLNDNVKERCYPVKYFSIGQNVPCDRLVSGFQTMGNCISTFDGKGPSFSGLEIQYRPGIVVIIPPLGCKKLPNFDRGGKTFRLHILWSAGYRTGTSFRVSTCFLSFVCSRYRHTPLASSRPSSSQPSQRMV